MAINEGNIASEKFWLNIAAENIYSTFEKRATSVKNLKLLIEWAFGLFASGGFVIGLFAKINEFPLESLLLFGFAFCLLTIAYALAGEAHYPVTQQFHPNNTENIAHAFSEAVKKQSVFFKWASGMTLIGFFFLSVAILFLFQNSKTPPKVLKVNEYPLLVNTSVEIKQKGFSIPVTVSTIPDTRIELSITGIKSTDTLLYDEVLKADTIGRLFVSYSSTDTTMNTFRVKVGIRPKNTRDTTVERFTSIRIVKGK